MGAQGQGSEEVIKSKQPNPKADSNLLTQNLSRDDTAEMTKVSLFISSKNSNSKNPVRGSLKKSEEEVEEEDRRTRVFALAGARPSRHRKRIPIACRCRSTEASRTMYTHHQRRAGSGVD